MIRKCCSAEVADAYETSGMVGHPPVKATWEVVRRSHINTYTTTLHAINSVIVKLSSACAAMYLEQGGGAWQRGEVGVGRWWRCDASVPRSILACTELTVASKVYRGIAGRLLPPQFFKPNEYGVCGGVDVSCRWIERGTCWWIETRDTGDRNSGHWRLTLGTLAIDARVLVIDTRGS